MGKIKKYSLKKALFLYLIVFLILFIILTIIIEHTTLQIQESIWEHYRHLEPYHQIYENSDLYGMFGGPARVKESIMTQKEVVIVNICDFLQSWADLILAIAGSIFVVAAFYNRKLKQPIKLLNQGATLISNNELEFEIIYDKKDELGNLCHAFELMRRELRKNNQHLWNMAEEQRIIRQAIVHDIRNPLYVIQGYADMLLEYLPSDGFEQSKAIDMAESINSQTLRLDKLLEQLKRISKLEEWEIEVTKVQALDLVNDLKGITDVLLKPTGLSYHIVVEQMEDAQIWLDENIFIEVYENILNNAMRYAKSRIEVIIFFHSTELVLEIIDDGKGFSKAELKELAEKQLIKNRDYLNNHLGMGLYLCKLLCKKHNGDLTVLNKEGGVIMIKFCTDFS
ncbi:HAMP domain-containing histidine kinase [Lachnospiraceae bacterium ZAX-1]